MSRLTSVRGRMARLALIGVAAAFLTGAGPAPDVYIQSLKGSVEIGSGEPPVWRAARDGDRLGPYDSIRTGADGRVEVRLSTGTVRLYPSSLLQLASDPGDSTTERVKMEQGTSLFDVLKRSGDDTFEVETHDALLVVKGTRFSVAVTPERSSLAVFRGLVGVSGLTQAIESEILVRPGFAAIGSADTPFELVVHSEPDPWSGWELDQPTPAPAQAIAPPAKIALDMARTSALISARPMVEKRAAELQPTPAATQPTRDAKEQESSGVRPSGVEEIAHGAEEPVDRSDPAGKAMEIDALKSGRGVDRDPLDKGGATRSGVQQEYVESVVEGSTGAAGFEIELVNAAGTTGSGGVKISAPSIDEFHSKGQLHQMVQAGEVNFSPALMQMLANQGVDPMQFAIMLNQMTQN